MMMTALLTQPAAAESFNFSLGGATTNVNVFETAQTGRVFYNGVRRTAFGPENGANFFFHRDTRDDTFSLLILADQFEDGTRGSLFGQISGLPTTATITRSDDASELAITSPGVATFSFVFNTRGIDGGVISGIDPASTNLTINFTSSTGLTSTNVIDPTGITQLAGAPGPSTTLFVAPNPEPSAWAFFILSFVMVGTAAKRQRRTMTMLQPVLAR